MDGTILKRLYWQHGHIGIAAIAVADGGGGWAAYIGALNDEYTADEVEREVVLGGVKLRETEAYGLFPSLMIGDRTYRA